MTSPLQPARCLDQGWCSGNNDSLSLGSTGPRGVEAPPSGPEMDQLLLFFLPFSCFAEEAAESETLRAAAAGKEKDSTRRGRDEPEKVVKHWEREPTDSEKETEDELSQETLKVTASGQEENRQREVGEAGSLRRTGLGAAGRDSGDAARRVSGDLDAGNEGEEEGKPLDLGRMESREIYRRPSKLDQKPLGELSRRESEGLESQVSEDSRRESEEIGKTDLGEAAEVTKAENGENVEEGEKDE